MNKYDFGCFGNIFQAYILTLNRILAKSSLNFIQTKVAHLFVVHLVVQIGLTLLSAISRFSGTNDINVKLVMRSTTLVPCVNELPPSINPSEKLTGDKGSNVYSNNVVLSIRVKYKSKLI